MKRYRSVPVNNKLAIFAFLFLFLLCVFANVFLFSQDLIKEIVITWILLITLQLFLVFLILMQIHYYFLSERGAGRVNLMQYCLRSIVKPKLFIPYTDITGYAVRRFYSEFGNPFYITIYSETHEITFPFNMQNVKEFWTGIITKVKLSPIGRAYSDEIINEVINCYPDQKTFRFLKRKWKKERSDVDQEQLHQLICGFIVRNKHIKALKAIDEWSSKNSSSTFMLRLAAFSALNILDFDRYKKEQWSLINMLEMPDKEIERARLIEVLINNSMQEDPEVVIFKAISSKHCGAVTYYCAARYMVFMQEYKEAAAFLERALESASSTRDREWIKKNLPYIDKLVSDEVFRKKETRRRTLHYYIGKFIPPFGILGLLFLSLGAMLKDKIFAIAALVLIALNLVSTVIHRYLGREESEKSNKEED